VDRADRTDHPEVSPTQTRRAGRPLRRSLVRGATQTDRLGPSVLEVRPRHGEICWVGPLNKRNLPGEIRLIEMSMGLTTQNKGCRAMKSSLRLPALAFALGFLDSPFRTVQAADNPAVVRISSTLTRTSDTVGQLSVTADIASGFRIYAQSQPRPILATTIAWATRLRRYRSMPSSPAVPPIRRSCWTGC